MVLLQALYVLSAVGLAVVGFNVLLLTVLYLIHRRDVTPVPDPPAEGEWPAVVVQLPAFNERHVVEQLIDAVSRLDYPAEKLSVQVLDDSTDDTVARAAAAVDLARARGVSITHIRRPSREGFKAGALEYGLTQTDAPFVAIFDADFRPQPDYLRQVMPHLAADERLGMVQARWAHLNAEESHLTRAQALALDAHFVVEQTARNRSGLLMNFSGTAGVWRRACIADSGGWEHDTLSEDIDLSYRAQMRGWRFLYLPELGVPAEIPPLMMGFKRQQSRWATGTVQCLLKYRQRLLRSDLTLAQKLEGLIHLGGYFLHPLLLFLLLLTLPLLLMGGVGNLPLAGLGLAMLGSPLEVAAAQATLHDGWGRRLAGYPVFMLMGVGITVSNAVAVLQALSRRPLPFRRTPKFRAENVADDAGSDGWSASTYTLPLDATTLLEIAFSLYAALIAVLAIGRQPALVPFMVLYALGFAYVAGLSLWQARVVRRAQPGRRMLSVSESGR
jgi:glycosyltransferase involved in cell wall biosynthesis